MKKRIAFLTTLSFALIIFLVYDVHSKRIIIENYKNQNEELQNLNAEQSYVLENITIISKLQHSAEGRSLENYTLYTTDGDSCTLKDRTQYVHFIFNNTMKTAMKATAGWNYQQSKQSEGLSELALVNVEALAVGEKPSLYHLFPCPSSWGNECVFPENSERPTYYSPTYCN